MRYTICYTTSLSKCDKRDVYWIHGLLSNKAGQSPFTVPPVPDKSRPSFFIPVFDSRVEAEIYARVLNKYFRKKNGVYYRFFIKKFDTPENKYRIVKDGKSFQDIRPFVQEHKLTPKYFQVEPKET